MSFLCASSGGIARENGAAPWEKEPLFGLLGSFQVHPSLGRIFRYKKICTPPSAARLLSGMDLEIRWHIVQIDFYIIGIPSAQLSAHITLEAHFISMNHLLPKTKRAVMNDRGFSGSS